jgi:hypothetical protein
LNHFLVGTDDEILFEAPGVHPRTVVPDLDSLRPDFDPDFGCVGIIGVIDEFREELGAFGIQALSDRDDVPLVDRDFEFFLFLDFHFRHVLPPR